MTTKIAWEIASYSLSGFKGMQAMTNDEKRKVAVVQP